MFADVGGGSIKHQPPRQFDSSLLAIQTEKHEGALAAEHSFVQLEPNNLILTAMKGAEDGSGLVFRFYEWAGKAGDAKIRLHGQAESASETNLMERTIGSLGVKNGAITIPIKPYEIKTIKVQLVPESRAEAGTER
jgi:alpha-mannosidase